MTVADLQEKLNLTPHVLPDPQREVSGGYTGDLLSWVMGRAEEGAVWVTIMSNENVVAVAALRDLACVVLAEGVQPEEPLIRLAGEHNINLLSTEDSAFTVCARAAGVLGR